MSPLERLTIIAAADYPAPFVSVRVADLRLALDVVEATLGLTAVIPRGFTKFDEALKRLQEST